MNRAVRICFIISKDDLLNCDLVLEGGSSGLVGLLKAGLDAGSSGETASGSNEAAGKERSLHHLESFCN